MGEVENEEEELFIKNLKDTQMHSEGGGEVGKEEKAQAEGSRDSKDEDTLQEEEVGQVGRDPCIVDGAEVGDGVTGVVREVLCMVVYTPPY